MWEVTNFGKQWLALCRSGKYNVGVFVQVIAMLKERLRNGAIFEFYDPGQLVDGDLTLVLYEAYPGDERRGYVPAYRFRMMRGDSRVDGRKQEVGRIELRVSNTHHIVMYAGHIGYRVLPIYRGHHYAARSCTLLLSLARRHGLNPLWITCNPDNYASRRTCELAGASFVETVDLPEDTDMYQMGERQKCRYRLDL
jgi:predicted acetyltransferase